MVTDPSFPIYPDLKGETALLVGIGQTKVPDSTIWGNGAAIARVLAHNGVKLFGVDINIEAVNFTASRLRDEVPDLTIEVTTADVTQEDSMKRVVEAMTTNPLFGRIDILINNVGIPFPFPFPFHSPMPEHQLPSPYPGMTAPGSPITMSSQAFQSQLLLNLTSAHHAISAAIVNNASLTALRFIGKPQIGYAAAKAGLLQYTRHLAALHALDGIRANCVVPGIIWTPLVENLGNSEKEEDRAVCEAIRKTGEKAPLGRMGTAEDVAMAVAFLCSERAAGFVTGQEIVVDGGLSVCTPY